MLVSALSVPPVGGPPRCPPPLLPKPGKDNLRLQKLLRKAAQRQVAMAGGRPPAPLGIFRTTLSPVSEASHDQEAPRPCGPHALVTRRVASPLQKAMLSPSPASQAYIQPALSSSARTLDPPRTAPEGEPHALDPTPHPPQAVPRVPVAHIHPLPAGVQAAQPRPEGAPVSRPPSGLQAPRPGEAGAGVLVAIAPLCRLPSPSPCNPPPEAPMDPTAQCPEMPPTRPTGPHPKVAAESQPSGWTRLKKQLLAGAEEPAAPRLEQGPESGPAPRAPAPRASRLWDAVLYRASVAEARGRPPGPGEGQGGLAGLHRLPLLCRPRFDARRLREVAWPPAPVLPVPKTFNRTAAGWRLP